MGRRISMSASPKKLTASIEDDFLVIKVPMNSKPVRSVKRTDLLASAGRCSHD
jgi:hypothetical protein